MVGLNLLYSQALVFSCQRLMLSLVPPDVCAPVLYTLVTGSCVPFRLLTMRLLRRHAAAPIAALCLSSLIFWFARHRSVRRACLYTSPAAADAVATTAHFRCLWFARRNIRAVQQATSYHFCWRPTAPPPWTFFRLLLFALVDTRGRLHAHACYPAPLSVPAAAPGSTPFSCLLPTCISHCGFSHTLPTTPLSCNTACRTPHTGDCRTLAPFSAWNLAGGC